jgi:hypothetical protein
MSDKEKIYVAIRPAQKWEFMCPKKILDSAHEYQHPDF